MSLRTVFCVVEDCVLCRLGLCSVSLRTVFCDVEDCVLRR